VRRFSTARGILPVSGAFGDVLEIVLCHSSRRTDASASAKVGSGFAAGAGLAAGVTITTCGGRAL